MGRERWREDYARIPDGERWSDRASAGALAVITVGYCLFFTLIMIAIPVVTSGNEGFTRLHPWFVVIGAVLYGALSLGYILWLRRSHARAGDQRTTASRQLYPAIRARRLPGEPHPLLADALRNKRSESTFQLVVGVLGIGLLAGYVAGRAMTADDGAVAALDWTCLVVLVGLGLTTAVDAVRKIRITTVLVRQLDRIDSMPAETG